MGIKSGTETDSKIDKTMSTKKKSNFSFDLDWLKIIRKYFDPQVVLILAGGLVIVTLLWIWSAYFGILPRGDMPSFKDSKLQAVFLENGQVYFGHVKNYNRKFLELSEVYYLQVSQPLQQGQEPAPGFNLVKLGGELHGPENFMFILKEKVLFIEDLRDNSRVVEAIRSFK